MSRTSLPPSVSVALAQGNCTAAAKCADNDWNTKIRAWADANRGGNQRVSPAIENSSWFRSGEDSHGQRVAATGGS